MLWPTVQIIENHWSGRPQGNSTAPHQTATETRAWPSRQEATQRIAEPASSWGEAHAHQDCKLLRSYR
jgi:hypothetical protein